MHVDSGSAGTGGKRGTREQDFEINLASIIDCLVVLITYLLVSTSFISLAMLDVSMATPSPNVMPEDSPPKVMLQVDLALDHTISVILVGGDGRRLALPAANGTWDTERLKTDLAPFREKYPDLQLASISADPQVEYDDLVRAVNATKVVMPTVYLGDRP